MIVKVVSNGIMTEPAKPFYLFYDAYFDAARTSHDANAEGEGKNGWSGHPRPYNFLSNDVYLYCKTVYIIVT
jgi:hypothetical protein